MDDGEFRLLQIEPAESLTTQIKARLFKASLDIPPVYEAVSYRWEGMKNAHSIIVNGTQFSVMDNVFSFLLELRRQAFPTSPTVWIDSVCINQNCTDDRNQQVQLMGRIYSKARVVRIWLGIESDDANKAFELVHRCGPADTPLKQVVAWNVINDEVGAKALINLLRRDYWNRMWVFQEIVLAKDAVVHCGQLQAPWPNFMWLDLVSSRHTLWHPAQVTKPWISEFRKTLFTITQFCVSLDEAHHVNNVLYPTRHLLCQDPRDKLFALRGVCDALTGMVKVDYSVPARDVFTAFAMNQILADDKLSALLTAGLWNPLNGEDINLPSWVPDLRGMSGVDTRYLAGTYADSFDADGGASSCYKMLYAVKPDDFLKADGNSIFKVRAIILDLVQIHRPLKEFAHSASARKRLIETFCLMLDDGGFSERRLSQLFECLIFGDKATLHLMKHTVTELHVQEKVRRLVLGFYEDLCQLFGPDQAFIDFLALLEHRFEGFEPFAEEVHFCGPGLLRLYQVEFLGRAAEGTDRQATALFLTADGRLGIGPHSVQQDDKVVIVRGCRVPLVLRRFRNQYRLVGPIYVSGIMQGEALWLHGRSDSANFGPIQLV